MAPPQLAADTPVLDVLQPHVVNLLKALWHNLDVSFSDSLQAAWQELPHAEIWQGLASKQNSMHAWLIKSVIVHDVELHDACARFID